VRHLEALAIASVVAVTAVLLYRLYVSQVYPVHQVGAQRGLAFALLKCQSLECFLNATRETVPVQAIYVDGVLVAGSLGASQCYAVVVVNATQYHVVRVCAKA
jgi:hypothetical protein